MSLIAAIFAVAALVWGAIALRHGGLLCGCLAVLLLGSCFGPPFFSHDLGPVPITSDRVLLAILAVTFVALRRSAFADLKPTGWADRLLVIFLAILALSAFSHNWRLNGLEPVAKILFFFLMPAAIYWIARQTRLTAAQLRMVTVYLVIFGCYLAWTNLAETRQMWWAVFPKYISSPDPIEFFGRGRGPFLNPVTCGLYLSAALAAVLVIPPQRNWQTAVRAFVALLLLIGVYSTLTRSNWLCAGVIVLFFTALHLPRRLYVPTGLITAVVLGGLILANWNRLNAFKRDENVSVHSMTQSASLRPILATVAMRMFWDRPLFGCGWGQYRECHVDYLHDSESELPLERARPYIQHNTTLAFLTETGLIGTGLFLALMSCWCRDAWMVIKCKSTVASQFGLVFAAVLFSYLLNSMFHEVSIIPMVHMLVFLLAGITRGLAIRGDVASATTPVQLSVPSYEPTPNLLPTTGSMSPTPETEGV